MNSLSKIVAIIPAAGSGSRMNLSQSKLLCVVGNKSVLRKTLEVFALNPEIFRIVIPCREQDRESFRAQLSEFDSKIIFVDGGQTRQESVKLGLAAIKASFVDHNLFKVIVHDAARCFITQDLLQRCIKASFEYRALTAAIDCVDTIYQRTSDGAIKLPLLNRSDLKSIQTPQIFDFPLLEQAHQQENISASDDAGLVASLGFMVQVIEGDRKNIKITTAEDLKS